MPELPEVETVRRELEPWLSGRSILRARRAAAPPGPKYAHLERAAGQRILAVQRRGKFMLLPLSGDDELIVHLGMTGVITARKPPNHLRVVLELSGRSKRTLYFKDPRRFGRFLVVPRGDYRALPTLAALGPEPLSNAFTASGLHAALRRRTAAIKGLLLGQRLVAGVGNIYADEALWRARIHPQTSACRVSRRKSQQLHQAIVEVLSEAIIAQGTTLNDYRTVNGSLGSYVDELNVYGHDGKPCRRCGTVISKSVVAQRGTHHCPRCQRARK